MSYTLAAGDPRESALSAELSAVLNEPEVSALRRLWQLLMQEGRWSMVLLAAAIALLTSGALLETVLLRAQLELDRYFSDPFQRCAAVLGALGLMSLLTVLELLMALAAMRLGRRIETGLRVAFMRKLPLLHDRYFQSRPVSDMADRNHMVHAIRSLPGFVLSLLRAVFGLIATGAGLVWLDPGSLWRVQIASVLSLGLPLLMLGRLTERDLRLRSHVASLSRSYLDALRGLLAIRAHHGETNVCVEHEAQLSEWKRASQAFARAAVGLECAVAICSVGLTSWLFLGYAQHVGEPVGALVFLYWALSFPVHGHDIASLSRQLPGYCNVLARLLEPLGGDEVPAQVAVPRLADHSGARLSFEDVATRAGGHTLLSQLQLCIEAGEHVAIVGSSGAGKSSLLGLLLGWYRPSQGRLLWNGVELNEANISAHRARTIWIDPTVQLWNRSLYDNLRYASTESDLDLRPALDGAELHALLQSLDAGLQTALGEAGCCLSGGEGQRVRLGRAFSQSNPELVLLDEPFRGLDRAQRARLLGRSRQHWAEATLLCVTHDIGETLGFGRVLVVENGRIVEDGAPQTLARDANSRYATLLRCERALLDSLSSAEGWRRLVLEHGQLVPAMQARAGNVVAINEQFTEIGVAE